ncbi:hypothetical protein PAHAL_1G443000 [Panicum hallii]|uniref:Uncharacterized protein n=1 Tax=Panicum hallii TaxID=206008 RepID=A0A2T8KYE7_9POAL|nr:hypothetical protein PAHAL_1G443000 [Panicum hallii]
MGLPPRSDRARQNAFCSKILLLILEFKCYYLFLASSANGLNYGNQFGSRVLISEIICMLPTVQPPNPEQGKTKLLTFVQWL